MTSLLADQIPPVPQIVMPATAQTVVTVIVAAVALAALAGALVLGRRHRTPLYPLVLLGGGLASLDEPIADLLGGCIHPQRGGWTAFSTFDRPIPVWVVLAYGLFFGLVPLVVLALMRGGDPRRRLLGSIGVIVAANLLIEEPVLAAGVYRYYGVQPFQPFGLLPLYWLFINATAVAAIAVVLFRFGHLARGARAGWSVLLPPAAQVAAFTVGLPAYSMYNTGAAPLWKWLGAIATMVIGTLALRALSRLVPDGAAPSAEVTAGSPRVDRAVGVSGS